uniref:MYND-type domain-containing protein n=1 Tax=Chromera velia CCMP2878 TaxID=1169474 RepID=A0A0K6SAE2_9ALVE|eukprot:Cvel_10546.t1-p1 / transcript=Cvel_10546.t1 / gene=Cvel_10546 / organism=Chromera_velia_CCMP2878 / gene_product=hypothetical protein / transcript_product=hypothetical protein / location=Cvel_scaffold638:57859-59180(+) / protein_length=296 / sequence_SO=supercontig / SO=protein_coding / is_pseudo=false
MKSRDFTETVEEQLARIRQGIHEQHQGKHQNAISIFNEVLNDIEFSKTLFRAPVASLPYFHRAKSHAALRNFETALSDLRACPKTDVSRSAHVIRFTGEVYKDMGRYEDARNFYSAALFAKAGDLTTQDCLEELDVLELGRFCQVPDWLKKDVLKRAPSDMKPVRISSTHLTVGTTHANASAGAQQGQKKSMIVDMEAFVLKEAVPAGTYVILEKVAAVAPHFDQHLFAGAVCCHCLGPTRNGLQGIFACTLRPDACPLSFCTAECRARAGRAHARECGALDGILPAWKSSGVPPE